MHSSFDINCLCFNTLNHLLFQQPTFTYSWHSLLWVNPVTRLCRDSWSFACELTSRGAAAARLVVLQVTAAVTQLLRDSAHCKQSYFHCELLDMFNACLEGVIKKMSRHALTKRWRGVGTGAASGETSAYCLRDICRAGGPRAHLGKPHRTSVGAPHSGRPRKHKHS